MMECPWEAKTPRVPVPAMDAVVVARQLPKGPAATTWHAEAIDGRCLGHVRRWALRPGRRRLSEPPAMKKRGPAFPAADRPAHEAANQVDLDALVDDPLLAHLCPQVQLLAGIDVDMTHQPISHLERGPDRQRIRG